VVELVTGRETVEAVETVHPASVTEPVLADVR